MEESRRGWLNTSRHEIRVRHQPISYYCMTQSIRMVPVCLVAFVVDEGIANLQVVAPKCLPRVKGVDMATLKGVHQQRLRRTSLKPFLPGKSEFLVATGGITRDLHLVGQHNDTGLDILPARQRPKNGCNSIDGELNQFLVFLTVTVRMQGARAPHTPVSVVRSSRRDVRKYRGKMCLSDPRRSVSASCSLRILSSLTVGRFPWGPSWQEECR